MVPIEAIVKKTGECFGTVRRMISKFQGTALKPEGRQRIQGIKKKKKKEQALQQIVVEAVDKRAAAEPGKRTAVTSREQKGWDLAAFCLAARFPELIWGFSC